MKPEPIYKTIGAMVRRRRRRLEWSQKHLAERLGISRAALANIETGRQRVLVHHLYTLAEALNMKPSDFIPPASLAGSARALARLPMPDDLNPEQKEQIARLIGPSQPPTAGPKERIDAKAQQTLPRRPR